MIWCDTFPRKKKNLIAFLEKEKFLIAFLEIQIKLISMKGGWNYFPLIRGNENKRNEIPPKRLILETNRIEKVIFHFILIFSVQTFLAV